MYPIFSVRDTGRGLSEAEQALLFARFSQTSPRTHIDYGKYNHHLKSAHAPEVLLNTYTGGSGLGLFISRRLAEMHGGAIGFASQAGVGSTFSFYIKSRLHVDEVPSEPPQHASEPSTTKSDHDASTRASLTRALSTTLRPTRQATVVNSKASHILIVEDNLVNQRVLSKQLQKLGFQVALSNHGGEALEYLRGTTYCREDESAQPLSLILMDWEMPVMNGLAATRNIRQLQKSGVVKGHVPVIGITANVRPEQVKDALLAGMDDVMSKPFRIPELCDCIEKTLGMQHDK